MVLTKRITAGASVLTLAAGISMVGAGMAGAQGSLEMIGDLPDTIADLQLADQALNGPVSVTSNAEGGPTVTYVNDTDIVQRCSGFTMPYATVVENDIDPNALDDAGFSELLELSKVIYAGGGVAIMVADENGDPVSFDAEENDIVFTLNNLIAKDDVKNTGTLLAPGEDVSWIATAPEEPAAAAIMCTPDADRSVANTEFSFGVDKQVVADQINGILGPLGSVGAGSISGGSVGLGAGALGSLADNGDGGEE